MTILPETPAVEELLSQEELELRVQERTAQLNALSENLLHEISERKRMEEEATSARELAEQAVQTKDAFLANITHELRTPMHGILSFSRFGIKNVHNAPRDKLEHYFKQINTSATRLTSLLNDLLDLAKNNAIKSTVSFSACDIVDIINGVVLEFNASIREKRIPLELRSPEFTTIISCDKTKIRQVISNLLTNAIKYSQPEKAIYFAFNKTILRHQPALAISIIDHGIGIPPGEEECIFNQFVQSSNTQTGAGGTGLGLAICREIVTAHQGIIHAVNHPEGGAAFTVTLPYAQPHK